MFALRRTAAFQRSEPPPTGRSSLLDRRGSAQQLRRDGGVQLDSNIPVRGASSGPALARGVALSRRGSTQALQRCGTAGLGCSAAPPPAGVPPQLGRRGSLPITPREHAAVAKTSSVRFHMTKVKSGKGPDSGANADGRGSTGRASVASGDRASTGVALTRQNTSGLLSSAI